MTAGLALNGEANVNKTTTRSQQLLCVATTSRCVSTHEGTTRGRWAVGDKQVKQEKQATIGALFMTETLPFSLELPISLSNLKYFLNKSCPS